ncbi:T-cell surface glycoprotein CD3 zeta chain-like isoform X1 [Sparus aurata]|uniref:T-cell surface glycoprotein CD3 zeta chain-like n=1 Tax=Sparus aurata TaxID=8175 RepID=A0A671XT45_SPAAU|nr:T-cell surface glycoprotein CD3 zeta chain-like isoform X1 [Sparus aurata]
MGVVRTGVIVLFVLLVPVSCKDVFFTEPVTCFLLDGILILYCIIATALYFREKFSLTQPVEVSDNQEPNGVVYQELRRPADADPYQVLEPSKRKKKAGKKKKSPKPGPAEGMDRDYEPLNIRHNAPPLSPH